MTEVTHEIDGDQQSPDGQPPRARDLSNMLDLPPPGSRRRNLAELIEAGQRKRVLNAPMFTPLEIDEVLGITAATLQFSRLEGSLVALDVSTGMLVPQFQLNVGAGSIRPLVAELNRDFLDAKNDPWGAAAWWVTPSKALPEGMNPADAVVAADGYDGTLRRLAADISAAWEPTVLPLTGITLDDARTRITGLHFAKESLNGGENGLLTIAEGLLRLLDIRHGGTAR